jgi:hypothetical protein
MAPAHILRLEKSIKSLKVNLEGFVQVIDWEELLVTIHRPGWTTVAEIAFTQAILDSLNSHVQVMKGLAGSLMKGSRAVSAK